MDYWKECIAEAFEDAEIKATSEQIDIVANWAEGAHDNYSMAHGYDVASSNFRSERETVLKRLEQELEYERNVSRKRCGTCKGHGILRDGWGRDFNCSDCNGEGSIRQWIFKFNAAA